MEVNDLVRMLLWIFGTGVVLDGIMMYLVILGGGRNRNRALEDEEQMEYLRQWSEEKALRKLRKDGFGGC